MTITTIKQGFIRRVIALVRKETRQILRDRSNLTVGLVLPIVLILLFGYGLSFDVTNAPIAVVLEDPSITAREAMAGLQGSPYLLPTWFNDMAAAEQKMRAGDVEGIVRVPSNFSRQLAVGQGQVQLLVNGVDSDTASAIENYVMGSFATVTQKQLDRAGNKVANNGNVVIVQRMWFNEASDSTWYLVPGLIVLVMTLIGAFLTSMLIAREWERGTLESLFVTPVRPFELVAAKLGPYIAIGSIDLVMCLLAARFLFKVPIRGSLWVIVFASILYLLVSLLLGLLISGRTRNQFEASQLALLVSFMPALMLSGFVFDIRNMPIVVRFVSQLLPATHFMGLIKTLFLAGNDWTMIVEKCGVLMLYVAVLAIATTRTLRKTLD